MTTTEDRVLQAADLQYQDHSVVSRVLLKAPKGNITLFAFDADEQLSEHTCPYDALIHVLEGASTITIGGVPHELTSGQMIVLPTGVPHAVFATTRFKMLLTILRA